VLDTESVSSDPREKDLESHWKRRRIAQCGLYPMENLSRHFGLIIAYLLPGFIGLAGFAPLVPAVAIWLQPVGQGEAGFGPPMYAVMGAGTLGMVLSCYRWVIIDTIHRRTGIVAPQWDDARLDERLEAFDYLVESHYRYYQFYANTIIAVLWAYPVHRFMKTSPLLGMGTDLGVLILCAVLFAGSRDALAKYYIRTSRLVGLVAEKDSDVMTNGNHHAHEAGAGAETQPVKKPTGKPEAMPKPEQAKAKPTNSAK
jgi:hypothetical protein